MIFFFFKVRITSGNYKEEPESNRWCETLEQNSFLHLTGHIFSFTWPTFSWVAQPPHHKLLSFLDWQMVRTERTFKAPLQSIIYFWLLWHSPFILKLLPLKLSYLPKPCPTSDPVVPHHKIFTLWPSTSLWLCNLTPWSFPNQTLLGCL